MRSSHECKTEKEVKAQRAGIAWPGHTAQWWLEAQSPIPLLCALEQLLPQDGRGSGFQQHQASGNLQGSPLVSQTPPGYGWAKEEGYPSCQNGPTRPTWARRSLPGSDGSMRSLGHPRSLLALAAVTQPCLPQTSFSREL